MLKSKKLKRLSNGLFYFLSLYIFVSFLWWSCLLYEKNKNLCEANFQIAHLQYNIEAKKAITFSEFEKTKQHASIKAKYDRQEWMILGEGLVFLILLLSGTIYLFNAFKKEIILARQQNNFLLSITHELKSPLASIKLGLQTIEKRYLPEEKFEKIMNNMFDDVDRLESLVDNILIAARMETHSYGYDLHKENISELIQKLIEKFKFFAGNKRVIKSEIQANIYGNIDPEAFSAAVLNLLENAYKYSSEHSQITIQLKSSHEKISLSVIDEGIGIAPEETQKIFNKFYRVGNENTRHTTGTGLGLFIVKKAVEAHGGKIYVKPHHPTGTIFVMEISALQ